MDYDVRMSLQELIRLYPQRFGTSFYSPSSARRYQYQHSFNKGTSFNRRNIVKPINKRRIVLANRSDPYSNPASADDAFRYNNVQQIDVSSAKYKLIISNLEPSVSSQDLQTLFSEFGSSAAEVHYNCHGQSLGTADVVFPNKISAIRAQGVYNGRPLDGSRMNIGLFVVQKPVINNRNVFYGHTTFRNFPVSRTVYPTYSRGDRYHWYKSDTSKNISNLRNQIGGLEDPHEKPNT